MRNTDKGINFAIRAANLSSPDRKYRVGAAIMRGRKLISIGWNSHKTHPSSKTRDNMHHAEFSCIIGSKKLDVSGSTMFIVRLNRTGNIGISYPCDKCYEIIRSVGIKKIVYIDRDSKIKLEKV